MTLKSAFWVNCNIHIQFFVANWIKQIISCKKRSIFICNLTTNTVRFWNWTDTLCSVCCAHETVDVDIKICLASLFLRKQTTHPAQLYQAVYALQFTGNIVEINYRDCLFGRLKKKANKLIKTRNTLCKLKYSCRCIYPLFL